MTFLDWLAWAVLSIQMTIPVFWYAVHPFVGFWRRHPRLVYPLVIPACWLAVGGGLFWFREQLFQSSAAPAWAVALGILIIAADLVLLVRIHRELGGARLVGKTELAGAGELMQQGLYARVRHPRYAGMMAAVFGACLVAGTLRLWMVAAVWWLAAFGAVLFEEKELRARFGAAYDAYARRVPRFLPFRFWPREE